MSWFEFHDEVVEHPKTMDMMSLTGYDLDTTIGKLARFWRWCNRYAQDGDLRKHNKERWANAVGLSGKAGAAWSDALIASGYVDTEPYHRVHDWWDYRKHYFKSKYKNDADKWKAVQAVCLRPVDWKAGLAQDKVGGAGGSDTPPKTDTVKPPSTVSKRDSVGGSKTRPKKERKNRKKETHKGSISSGGRKVPPKGGTGILSPGARRVKASA